MNAANTTALTVYDRMADPVAAIEALGKAIAKSRFLGCDNVEQGQVMAMECMARRMPPLMLAEKYHVIDGKLSMRADAMLAAFNEAGGKHRIVSRTADCAEIELTFAGQTYNERLTWAEAQAEPFPWTGKPDKAGQPVLKKNWATPRARKQMLWARVVSDAVRAMMPGVNCGRYTPEELGEVNSSDQSSESSVVDADYQVIQPAAPAPAPTTPEQPAPAETHPATSQTDEPDQLRRDREQIKNLWSMLQPTETQIAAMLAKRGAQSVMQLTAETAAELRRTLENAWAATEKKRIEEIGKPITDEQIGQIKGLLATQEPLTRIIAPHLVKIGGMKSLHFRAGRLLLEAIPKGEAAVQAWTEKDCEAYGPL